VNVERLDHLREDEHAMSFGLELGQQLVEQHVLARRLWIVHTAYSMQWCIRGVCVVCAWCVRGVCMVCAWCVHMDVVCARQVHGRCRFLLGICMGTAWARHGHGVCTCT
jgi:hypothetical protein